MPNEASIMLSHEEGVGVKWKDPLRTQCGGSMCPPVLYTVLGERDRI
jgi:hypothetical protein